MENSFDLLIELEKEFGLLSKDMIYQEDLFEMQDRLTKKLADDANGSDKKQKKLLKELPYLFKADK